MEGSRISGGLQEGFPPKEKRKHFKPMGAIFIGQGEQIFIVPGKIQDPCEVNLEKLFGYGARALIVEPPLRTVGENTPT